MKNHNILIFLLFVPFLLTSCTTAITTIPAALLGAKDKYYKREKWLKYAEGGDVYSQYELAQSYCCASTEGQRDYNKSLKWFCTAAKNGYAKAQVEIGKLYENISVIKEISAPKDNVMAYVWYSLAARRINEEAINRRNYIKDYLSAEEIKSAKNLLQSPKSLNCISNN